MNLLWVLKIGYCIISRLNGISCRVLTFSDPWRVVARFLAIFFLQNLQFFKFFDIYCHYLGFLNLRGQKSSVRICNKLLNFCCSWINIQLFNITSFSIFYKTCNLSLKFLKFFVTL